MTTPLFFPAASVVEHIEREGTRPLRVLIEQAGAQCRASGPWTLRPIAVVRGAFIDKEPGDWSAVRIGIPSGLSDRDGARYAVAAMAYGLMDLVARESIRGEAWSRPAPPRGRPRTGRAQSNAERQRGFRARAKPSR